MDIVINKEKLSFEELYNLFNDTKKDFNWKQLDEIKKYAEKLIMHANFVVSRSSNNSVIGFIAFYENQMPTMYLSHVWVANQYRGKGIAGKLINFLIQNKKCEAFKEIRLEVVKDNHSAIRTYQKLGFKFIKSGINKNLMELKL